MFRPKFASKKRDSTAWRLPSSSKSTVAFSLPGSIETILTLVSIRAPAARATRSSSDVTTPIPPTHLPLAGLISDHVIEKTAVLQKRRVVRMRQNADLGIGEHQSAHEIALQMPFKGEPQRLFHQAAPGFTREFVGLEKSPQLVLCRKRLQHCVPDLVGENAT